MSLDKTKVSSDQKINPIKSKDSIMSLFSFSSQNENLNLIKNNINNSNTDNTENKNISSVENVKCDEEFETDLVRKSSFKEDDYEILKELDNELGILIVIIK